NSAVKEIPYAFVDATPKSEPAAGGSDVLPAVLPSAINLLAPFAPRSDAAWLTAGTINAGVINFNFTANTGPSRVGNLTVLGQPIAVTQATGSSPTANPQTVNVAFNTAQTITLTGSDPNSPPL